MKSCVVCIALALCLSPLCHAGSVAVAQWLPWNFVKSEMLKLPLDTSVTQNEMDLSFQELKPKAQGVSFHLSGALSELQFNRSGISAFSNNLSAQLHINAIKIEQTLVKVIAGNQISIRLSAQCGAIQINIPQFSAKMLASFAGTAASWQPKLSDVVLQIANNWSISPIQCSGVSGLEQEISTRLTEALTNPALLQSYIVQWLGDQLEATWLAMFDQLMHSTSADFRVTSLGQPSDLGLMAFGELVIRKSKAVALPSINEATLSQVRPQLLMSQAGLETIMEDRLFAMIPERYNLQEVDGFKKLMGSRLTQSFVWPDLRRFPANNPFFLTPDPNQSALSLKSTATGLEAQLRALGTIQTFIQLALIDYINWDINLKTPLKLTIQNGTLSVATGKADMSLSYYFGPLYVLIYKPNQKISVGLIQDSIKGLFENQSSTQELPMLEWQNRKWKIQNYVLEGALVTMDWGEV